MTKFGILQCFTDNKKPSYLNFFETFMIHSVFIQLYRNILMHLNLLDYCTALDSQILVALNLIKVNKSEDLNAVTLYNFSDL